MKIPQAIKDLPNDQLREIIRSLNNVTWEEDAPIRALAREIHGEDNTMTMLMLAVPLAMELEERTTIFVQELLSMTNYG